MKLWPKFYYLLPAKFVYYCAMRVWNDATTGVYGNTLIPEITFSEAIQRFARIHGLAGHGADEHFDSNRKRDK